MSRPHYPPFSGSLLGVLSAGLVLLSAPSVARAQNASEALPAYTKSGALSGSLKVVGSETMDAVMALWIEEFTRLHPTVTLAHESAGSGTAPAALLEGRAQLGAMSRPMKAEELATYERAKGYKPLEIRVAADAIAVFVPTENPVRGLTLADLKSIFTLRSGTGEAKTWGELGLVDDWATKPIQALGRDANSGTAGYFQEIALGGAAYHPKVVTLPGTKSILKAIAGSAGGISYASPEATTSKVRIVPIGRTAEKFVEPSSATCTDRSYPLSRFLYLYLDRKPGTPADPTVAAFLRYVLSREGQATLVKAGLFPLAPGPAQEERNKLN